MAAPGRKLVHGFDRRIIRRPREQHRAAVLDHCATVVALAGSDERRQRMNFWSTLALMRCVASSPAAAVQALRTYAGIEGEDDALAIEERIFDGTADSLPDDDVEPPAAVDDRGLKDLIDQAERLSGQSGDPKLKLLADHVGQLLGDGFSPVVFCRYIATAHYLGIVSQTIHNRGHSHTSFMQWTLEPGNASSFPSTPLR